MKIRLTIDCVNAAFADGNAWNEVARILRAASDECRIRGEVPRALCLIDLNGNTVGKLTTTGKAPQ